MNILLAVDGSAYTKRMLAYLAAHSELIGTVGGYTAATIVPALPQHAARFLPQGVEDDYYRDEAEVVLRPVRAFAAQQGWSLQAKHAIGQPGDAIAEMAETGKYDLVIMGSHGRSAVTGALMGSVATRVLARCKIPLLLIR